MKKYQVIECKEDAFPKGTKVCPPRLPSGALFLGPLWAGMEKMDFKTKWVYLGEIRAPGMVPYAVIAACGYRLGDNGKRDGYGEGTDHSWDILVSIEQVTRTLLVPPDGLRRMKGDVSMPSNTTFLEDTGDCAVNATIAVNNARLHLRDLAREHARAPIKFS